MFILFVSFYEFRKIREKFAENCVVFVSDDSDLHLQVDKESFLSAKPLHEGAFGYAWAGVRATHGVSFGKVQKVYNT